MPVSFCAGALASYYRLLTLHGVRRFRKIAVEGDSSTTVRGTKMDNAEDYEVSIRFIYFDTSRNDTEVELAENIILAGIGSYPKNVWLQVIYSTFMSEIRHNLVRSESLLAECHSLAPSFSDRYFLHLRDRLNKEKIQASSTADSLDTTVLLNLAAQKATEYLEEYERSQRSFYKALSARQVIPERLRATLKTMASLRSKLKVSMSRLMKSHSKSVPIMRLFGRYLNHVRNDAVTGCAFLAEADRIESDTLDLRRRLALFNVDLNNVDDSVDRIITIDRFGTIIRVTTRLARM